MEERNSYNVSVTCYGLKAAKRYGVDVVNYGILAGDVKNMKHLGNLACSNIASCFGQIQSAIQVKLYFDPVAGYEQFRHNEISCHHS